MGTQVGLIADHVANEENSITFRYRVGDSGDSYNKKQLPILTDREQLTRLT